MSQGGRFGLPVDEERASSGRAMYVSGAGSAGSCRLLTFADAEAKKEEEVRESMVSWGMLSSLRTTSHQSVRMSEASLPQRRVVEVVFGG